jgi:hypothetical protein
MGSANTIRREYERKMGESALAFILGGKVDKHEDERGWDDHWENGIDGESLCYWIGYACGKKDDDTNFWVDKWIATYFAHHTQGASLSQAFRRGHNARRNKGKKQAA